MLARWWVALLRRVVPGGYRVQRVRRDDSYRRHRIGYLRDD